MKNKKKFDCVEMMHEGALRIYEETRNMTVEEELKYWQEKSEKYFPDRFRSKERGKTSKKTHTRRAVER